ncbi:unnamed protein product [Ascophyllum nodosum]
MKRHLLTSAAATLMVVAYTSQSPCVWGFSALRAVTRSPQSLHRHSSDDIDETMPAITRAGALTATFGGVLIVAARSSFAAIPTTEDYAIGSGTKIKPARVQEDGLSASFRKSSVNPNNLVEVIEAVHGELDRMQALVQEERWGDALTGLRSFPLKVLKSPTMGLGSVGDVARSLGVTKTKASEILEASVEAGLTLRQVEDVVFSNTRTLEFFNSADLEQVENLKKGANPVDLTEPLQLLSDTKKLVHGVKNLMEDAAL